jgi:phage regulator Rha-like protein
VAEHFEKEHKHVLENIRNILVAENPATKEIIGSLKIEETPTMIHKTTYTQPKSRFSGFMNRYF